MPVKLKIPFFMLPSSLLVAVWTLVCIPHGAKSFTVPSSKVTKVSFKWKTSRSTNDNKFALHSSQEDEGVDCETRRSILSTIGITSVLLGGGNGGVGVDDGVGIGSSIGFAKTLNEEPNTEYGMVLPGNQIIPFSSVRQQKVITLSNGLKVLLVNDSKSSQSTASLIIHGPGQFEDPDDLPGAAHLMEHMIMSYKVTESDDPNANDNNSVRRRWMKKSVNYEQLDGDLEDWLSENGGASNAFTAYDETCFHINCQHDTFPRALDKFASLFKESNVIQTCEDRDILKREVSRVDAELDVESLPAKIEMITKSFIQTSEASTGRNTQHPYSKFARGSLESLQTIPELNGVDVSKKLIDFFKKYYLSSQAVLVVVTNLKAISQQSQLSSLSTMESWVSKFNDVLSIPSEIATFQRYHYPARFNKSAVDDRRVLLNGKGDDSGDKITIQWIINEDYRNNYGTNKAIEIAFVLNQIFGRRGTGSLFSLLRENNWIQNKNTLPPQVTVPINVSGFQLLKLELSVTPLGLQSQSDIIAAVFDSINAIKAEGDSNSFEIPEEFLAKYASTAKLYGYLLTPRPPDAVELAVDTMRYGIDVVNSRKWYRFPSPDLSLPGNNNGLRSLQETLKSVFQVLSDPRNALIITSSDDLSKISRKGINRVKPFAPALPVSTLLYSDDKLRRPSTSAEGQLINLSNNDLVPFFLSPPRLQPSPLKSSINNRKKSNDDSKEDRRGWAVLEASNITPKMFLPRTPPEPNIRCLFVLQLLSSKPARATAEQAAYAELWRQSFDEAVYELTEQGALGGLAYELRFNQWGLRVSILGISQNIAAYTKQVFEQLTAHHVSLAQGVFVLNNRSPAILEAKKVRNLTPIRKNTIIQTLQKATASDVAQEGLQFLQSCSGAVCFSQGDLTYDETKDLLHGVEEIFDRSIVRNTSKGQVLKSALPSIDDLVDTPTWKPRNASPCYLSGVSLMCDACGRVLR